MLEKHEVSECRIEKDGEKILLKREGPVINYQTPQFISQPSFVQQSQSVAPIEIAKPLESKQEVVQLSRNLLEVKSPMVGTFYRKPAVDAKAFVEVGDVVKKGQVLCIVEAMKLMNEIESEVSGVITEICLDDATMVEYGEVMFRVEPK